MYFDVFISYSQFKREMLWWTCKMMILITVLLAVFDYKIA